MSGVSLQLQLRQGAVLLRRAEVPAPEAEARILACHLLGLDPTGLFTAPAMDLAQHEGFLELLARRAAGAPVQHLTGETWFRHVRLEIGPGAFVPRPETEVVAGWVVEQLATLGPSPLVVDLCTGSGAIARAVADEVPGARVHAVELSEDALVWAGRNLAGSGAELHAGDMADALPELDGRVDVVVCNPPYIPLEAWESVAPDVRDHDPHLALFSGADGLDAMRVLADVAARLLRSGGRLAAEHAEVQEHSVVQLFLDHGRWGDVRDHRDLNDRPRFVTAVRH